MRNASTRNSTEATQAYDRSRVSDLLKKIEKYRPVREITDQLEKERSRRCQLMWIGVPAQILFFGLGLTYPHSNYILIELIPLVLLSRLFFLKTLNVALGPDNRINPFLNAVAAFPVHQSVQNDITGDRVRILLKATFRRVRWPFRVLILEQRWKKTNDQFFLVIGPEFYWWSKGSIWFPWHWSPGRNAELEFSKITVGGSDKKFCIKFRFTESPEWTLRFKTENARDQTHRTLEAIREFGKSANKTGDAEQTGSNKKAENRQTNQKSGPGRSGKTIGADQPENMPDCKAWHEVLRVAPDASTQDITIAYKKAIKKCHPDTVANHSELIKQAAAAEATQINMAYRDARAARGF
jgi:DnaJ-domain-containing protein 1